ncbi:putative short-chain dehydrogenases/reductase [Fusarium tricinctum]|uniref:Short-chain dehydrogenases/reductase n=1 Tax=Fusarium tricinctum TaxID=61284 RepID=A0A8K0S646_9HYPO|nr:putative short-chain dehydrogenases/reductase [Fusarium tricinctum]
MSPSPQRSVLITGCSQGGAGNALALEFASRGLRVFATARSLTSLTNLTEKGIETFTLDVAVPESIAALKEEIIKRTAGKLDILYNNAGIMYEAPAIEADPARVRKMFDSNVFGLFEVVTAFAPLIVAAVPGASASPTIVNVSSVIAHVPIAFSSAYNASKAAVCSYSDTLRLELSPLGVRVVTLFMGEVSTALISTDGINFGPESLYADVEYKVKERTTRHFKVFMTPDAFAKQVIPKVLDNNGGSSIWKGTNAFIIWLLHAIGPQSAFDSIIKSGVGSNNKSLVKKIYE